MQKLTARFWFFVAWLLNSAFCILHAASVLKFRVLLVPIRRLLVCVRDRQDDIVSEERTDDRRALRLRIRALRHPVREHDCRVSSLVRQADIAVALGISVGAVRQRFYAAKKKLAEEYNRLESRKIRSPAAQKGGAW